MKHLKIGAMAEACSVTPRALRLYQEEGILQPELVDDESGYRSYSMLQSTKLDMIVQLQSAGFTLREIAQIEESQSVPYLKECVERRSRELDEKICELLLAKKINDELAAGCDQYLGRPSCGHVVLERLDERHILLFDAPCETDLNVAEGYTDVERWGWYQQYVKRCLIERGYPLALFRRVGCYVPQDKISKGMNLIYSQPFVFVDESFGAAFDDSTTLPGGVYLTAYYDTCHTSDGADLDESRVDALLGCVRQRGYTIAGPYVMENIFRFTRFFDSNAHAYFRHMLPVSW